MGAILTLGSALSWMRRSSLDVPETKLDDFQAAIAAASQAVIDVLQFDPTVQQTTERYSGTGTSTLVVNRKPITAVSAVTLRVPGSTNVMTVDPTQIDFDGREIMWVAGAFVRGPKNVSVTYTAGYTALPATIVQAALYTLKAMWTAADVDHNATGESYDGVLSQSFWPSGPGAVPPQARGLLGQYAMTILAS